MTAFADAQRAESGRNCSSKARGPRFASGKSTNTRQAAFRKKTLSPPDNVVHSTKEKTQEQPARAGAKTAKARERSGTWIVRSRASAAGRGPPHRVTSPQRPRSRSAKIFQQPAASTEHFRHFRPSPAWRSGVRGFALFLSFPHNCPRFRAPSRVRGSAVPAPSPFRGGALRAFALRRVRASRSRISALPRGTRGEQLVQHLHAGDRAAQ